jgi:mannose-6-phosphate isomerase-like protein (cupin superfamily)
LGGQGVGPTNWHTHEDQDEVFLLIEGHLTIQMRDRNVELGPGELFVIPRGTEHCPGALAPEERANRSPRGPRTSFRAFAGILDE